MLNENNESSGAHRIYLDLYLVIVLFFIFFFSISLFRNSNCFSNGTQSCRCGIHCAFYCNGNGRLWCVFPCSPVSAKHQVPQNSPFSPLFCLHFHFLVALKCRNATYYNNIDFRSLHTYSTYGRLHASTATKYNGKTFWRKIIIINSCLDEEVDRKKKKQQKTTPFLPLCS